MTSQEENISARESPFLGPLPAAVKHPGRDCWHSPLHPWVLICLSLSQTLEGTLSVPVLGPCVVTDAYERLFLH